MALRIYNSTIEASNGGFKSAVPGTALTAFLTSSTTVRPLAFAAANLAGTVTEVVLQQDSEGGEVLHRLYKGPSISLQTFMDQLVNDAVRAGAITPLSFVAEKGMKLTFTGANCAGSIVWNFCSDCGSMSLSGAEAEAEG
jgi:hypothetical protein